MDLTTEVSPGEAGMILTVDLDAIVANWQTLRVVCGEAECAAVVKADAYGMGLGPVVGALYEAGCKTFFVAHVFEGRAARAIALDAAIFVMNGLRPGAAPLYADFNLAPVLCSVPEIEDWGQYCAMTRRRTPEGGLLPAAFRFETGLNQLGLKPYDLEHGIHLSHLFDVKLVMTQLAHAGHEETIARQIETFETMRARLPQARASIANSGAIFLEANPLYDVVRPGYALYGGNPAPGRPNPMKPVVRLELQVIQVRILEPGERVGEDQGLGWRAGQGASQRSALEPPTASRLWDHQNQNGAGGAAIVQGTRCPYIGGVGMDLVAVDTSDSGYIERGDIVEMIGPSITIDDFAAAAGISGYEVLSALLGKRCCRRYQKL